MGRLYTIGIDFGTANSCVAVAAYRERGGFVDPDPQFPPRVLPFGGQDTVPTVLYAPTGGKEPPDFGHAAEKKALRDPQRLFAGFKLHLGSPETGQAAFLMARYFFACLLRHAASAVPLRSLPMGDRVETVVGHPVQWNADQREATLRAAREAGFANVRLEEESLAALYSHIFDPDQQFMPQPDSHVLTIDMGGGTTDFAFLRVPAERDQPPVSLPVHPVLAEGPDTYGGRYLDNLLLVHVAKLSDAATVVRYRRQLLWEIRRFKEKFSDCMAAGAQEYEDILRFGETRRRVRLTRDGFERLAGDYIGHFEVLVRRALEDAGLRSTDVTHLVLTGGHSRWYWVERTLGRVFPHLFVGQRTLFRHRFPSQSVALGLAFSPLVRSASGSFLAPRRRAVHAVWLRIPRSSGGPGEPILVLPRGTLLPYRAPTPLRFWVEQPAVDLRETQVSLQFLSGAERRTLADRAARFERGLWEQVGHVVGGRLPWASAARPDRFEVQVDFQVNEHELIHADLAVTRFLRGRPVDTQRQALRLSAAAAGSRMPGL